MMTFRSVDLNYKSKTKSLSTPEKAADESFPRLALNLFRFRSILSWLSWFDSSLVRDETYQPNAETFLSNMK